MEKIGTFAAVLAGIFIVVFVTTFLWAVGREILRWTVIAAVAYAAIVVAARAVHLGDDGAAVTIAGLLWPASDPHCGAAGSSAARAPPCAGAARERASDRDGIARFLRRAGAQAE